MGSHVEEKIQAYMQEYECSRKHALKIVRERLRCNARVLKRIQSVGDGGMPMLTNLLFVRHVREGRHWDADHAWQVYISHDACHDDPDSGHVEDRNTVVAFGRRTGTYKVIGREVSMKLAMQIALGQV